MILGVTMTKLDKIIQCISNKHVYIQTHNFPDPDAIASAVGLQYLLDKKGIKSTICYKGKIERSTAASMVRKLGIDIVEYNDIKQMDSATEIILVDSQKGNSNTIDLCGNEIICIDHHPTFEKAVYQYSDIRPDVGACASIIASYFFENDIVPNVKIATALMYGIKIDTANLTRGVSQLDLDMFYRIYNLTDKKLLRSFDTSTLQIGDLKAFANAIDSLRIKNGIAFANIGENGTDALIATISDFVLKLDEANLAVVYSMKDDGIKMSVRSDGKYNAGRIINSALKGIGNGGGHENMAGGFVPFHADQYTDNDERNKDLRKLVNTIESNFDKNAC